MFTQDDDDATEEEKAATKARQERMANARRLKEEKDARDNAGKEKKVKAKLVEKSLVVLEGIEECNTVTLRITDTACRCVISVLFCSCYCYRCLISRCLLLLLDVFYCFPPAVYLVKPWEADTDLKMVWEKICEYEQEGLTWGATFKLEPVAYGIMKLVMTATIVDR